MEYAKRMAGLRSAIFAELETKKRRLLSEGREVFDFSVGTPDLSPPAHIMEIIAEESTKAANYRYAINDSLELIQAAQVWYQRRFAVDLADNEIMSLLGSQDGLAHIALALIDPGDTVLVPDPGYPIFSVGPVVAGANIVRIPLLAENDFLIDFDRIDPQIAQAAKLMIVSYPNNPVTAMAPPAFYERLVDFARRNQIIVLHDNAYCELVFDGRQCGSFLNTPGAKEVGIELNSLSKSYNLPGCRVSFALGNAQVLDQLRILKSHFDYGMFIPFQKAAIAAITGPQACVRETVRAYQKRRNLIVEGFSKIGWAIPKPPATMFVWAPIPSGYSSSVDFTMDLLEKTGVIVVPGSSFGPMGEGYIRLAMVQPEERILKAIDVIRESSLLNSSRS